MSVDWDNKYLEKDTPWDLGEVTPAVAEFVASKRYPYQPERVLVPGCGRAYDVLEFTKIVKDSVTALDCSSESLDQAKKLHAAKAGFSKVNWLVQDFFKYSPAKPFDLVFDYTFLCALDHELRPAWAQKMTELIVPGGFLLSLIFPLKPFAKVPDRPPHQIDLPLVKGLLDGNFDLHSSWECPSVPERTGFEIMALWRRIRR